VGKYVVVAGVGCGETMVSYSLAHHHLQQCSFTSRHAHIYLLLGGLFTLTRMVLVRDTVT